MLERTDKKIQSYYDNEPQIGADGQLHAIDRVTRINRRQCEALAELHLAVKPDLSIETGLAYGFSTLPILDAMEEHNYGHHIAIDPGQMQLWEGIALTAVDQLGFSKRFTWMEARSDRALPKLIEERKRVQFVFFDGLHTLDAILTDFFLADQMLDIDGMLVFNDMWLPAVRTVATFFVTNMENYKHIPVAHENIFVVRKTGPDNRSWDHFVPFDAKDEGNKKPKGFFQKLLSGGS